MNSKFIILLIILFSPFYDSYAQKKKMSGQQDERLNVVKFNALSLLSGQYAFEYERLLTNRITIGAAVGIRPEKGLPFVSIARNYIDVEDAALEQFMEDVQLSHFSITPEIRFYLSRKGAFRGVYIAPYGKFADFQASIPFDFDVDYEGEYQRSETIPLKGHVRSFTAGISFGANFKLTNRLYLDWRLIGPGYGFAKGDLSGKMALDEEEQAGLRFGMDELQIELKNLSLPVETDYDVRADGANIRILRSPWAGIRTGFSLAYRF